MPKIAILGAGSAVFSKNIIADILSFPTLSSSEIALMDIDAERLSIVEKLARAINETLGAGASIVATKNRREALAGADFVISTIGVGGAEATKIDLELPLRFGLKQIIGDTLGVGGIFRSARSIPVLLDICREMEELCPRALLMNYANPMATHVLAVSRASPIRIVGLCHGVVNTARTMRMLIAMRDVPASEIDAHFRRPWGSREREEEWLRWYALGEDPELSYTCAGINHLAAFLRFESRGVDLYPRLRELLEVPHFQQIDPVRFELFRWFGYYFTETSGHCAEYLPYFLRDESEIARCNLPVASYVRTVRELDEATREIGRRLDNGERPINTPYRRSIEYASRIIHAVTSDEPFVFNGNVHNRGGALISNLPGDCCVEVPCVANRAGITPTAVGDLPPQIAGLIRTNVSVQDLAVRGILERKRDYFYQAAALDPNTASSLTLSKIRSLIDAMLEAHAGRIPSLEAR